MEGSSKIGFLRRTAFVFANLRKNRMEGFYHLGFSAQKYPRLSESAQNSFWKACHISDFGAKLASILRICAKLEKEGFLDLRFLRRFRELKVILRKNRVPKVYLNPYESEILNVPLHLCNLSL